MNKKILSLIAAISVALYSSSVSAMAIPSHSIVVGNKAYSIDYVVNPANYGEINSQMLNSSNVYYVVNSNTIKDLFTNEYVSTNVIDSISTITYIDRNGEQYIARSGSDSLEHIVGAFTATAKVEIGNGVNLIKKITVNSTSIPDVNYFKISGSSYIKPVGNPLQITSSQSSVTVYFYNDSAGNKLIATGTLDISNSTGSIPTNISNLQYAVGNSSGNINNLGLAASDADNQWIYYRGTGGDLFRIKTDGVDRTQLTVSHDAQYINVVGNQLYYVHTNAATRTTPAVTGVYKMSVDGSDAAPIMSGTRNVGTMGNLIFSTSSGMEDVIVAGDWIYYINSTDKGLYRANINGYSNQRIGSDKYTDINIVKNSIYVVNQSDNNSIYKVDLGNGVGAFTATKVSDVQAKHLNVVGNYMYYRNYADNEKLYRMSITGDENKKLCDDMALNINVCGDTIYYKNHSDADKLYEIGADGTGGQIVLSLNQTKGTKLSNDVVEYVNAIDPNVYYAPSNLKTLTSISKDGSGKTTMK